MQRLVVVGSWIVLLALAACGGTVSGGVGDADDALGIVDPGDLAARKKFPVVGQCGSANGVPVSTAPSTGLCSSGTASTVSGTGPWTWTCIGSRGGSTASCSAPLVAGTGTGNTGGWQPPADPCLTGALVRESPPSTEEFAGPFPSWKNVKSYGAVGNGVADDTAAIQAALNDLKSMSTNTWSVLYFPPGTYRITSQLTTTRASHHDYLGGDIVGDDPATTTLVWDGAIGGDMLFLDAWYNKVSRLTFDGKGKASVGLVRAGSFATYGELSDLEFRDFTGGALLLGNGGGGGIAEQAILRCRFYRSHYAISTWNYNSLDIYIWNSYFEDNAQAIRNASGAFHAYQNRFVRSTEGDLIAFTNMQSSVVGNVSVGSKAFFTNMYASAHVQGNLVYTTAPLGFDASSLHAVTMLDNLVVSTGGVTVSQTSQDALWLGNVFVGASTWPVRPPMANFNHGDGGSYVIGHPIEMALDGDPSTYSTQGLWGPGGLRWNLPAGQTRALAKYAITFNGYQLGDAPADFALFGSNDLGSTWTMLHWTTGQTWAFGERKEFLAAGSTAYAMYEMRVTKTVGGSTYPGGGFFSVAELELVDGAGANLVRDPAGLITGINESWGNITYLDSQVLPEGQCGTAPPTLQPWPFVPKVQRKVFEVGAFTGAAIQSAINLAALEPAGSRPVVHLPKGIYAVAATITVPAQVALSIIGDGGSEHGAVLQSSVANAPAMVLTGPSRATLRDFTIGSGVGGGLAVNGADQVGGRIYGNQLGCGGPGGDNRVSVAADVNGIEQGDVTMVAFGLGSFTSGVRATGGPVRATGQWAPGQVAYLTGASSHGNRNYDVVGKGELVVTGVWYEGDWAYQAPLVDLGASSSGSLILAAGLMSATTTLPIVRTQDFAGSLTLLNFWLDHRDSTHLDFLGNGANTNVFGFGNDYPMFTDPAAATKTPDQLWVDTTSPSGQISQIGLGTAANYTNKVLGAVPDPGWVRERLRPLRSLRIEQPSDRVAGATDVKLFRILVTGGANQVACSFTAK